MDKTFDEAYARYQSFLAKLDKTNDIAEKNHLFRELTEQLAQLEMQLNSQEPEQGKDDPEITYWI
jgi:hypothetical protein